jgi:hypothetical protein
VHEFLSEWTSVLTRGASAPQRRLHDFIQL